MWISPKQLAVAMEVDRRTVRKIIARTLAGKSYKGSRIEVRKVPSARGGRNGVRYEIAAASLPEEVLARLIPHDDSSAARTSWTHEERAFRHEAFAKMPTASQLTARARLAAVVAYHEFDNTDVPVRDRLAAAAAKANKSPSAVRGWVKACRGHHRGDWLVVLAPRHRGCVVKADFNPEMLAWIKDQYLQLSKPALKPIFRRAADLAPQHCWGKPPSYATVLREIRKLPRWLLVMKREGAEAFDRLFPAQQRDYGTLKLHELWVSDGRRADVFVRWEDGTVGRPIVVAWMECRSRVLLGYAIDKVEGASVVRLSLKSAVERSHALPQTALVDNGRSYASKMITGGSPTRNRFTPLDEEVPGILTLLGIKVIWAQPGRARSKPIESLWRTFAEMDKRFGPAYCGNRPEARPDDCDPAKAIPIATYRAAFDATMQAHNASPHRGDGMHGRSPREVYETLLKTTEARQPTAEQLRMCLHAAELVKLDRRDGSVNVHGNRYWTEKLAELPTDINYVVRYDPDDLGKAVTVYRGEQFVCEAPLLSKSGFNSQQAAKVHLRAQRRFNKGLREQAAAHQDMARAARWMAPAEPTSDEVSNLPRPTLPRLVHPLVDYRARTKERSAVGKEHVLEALAARAGRKRL